MLFLIGIGYEPKDISLKGLDAAKRCSTLYLESYTNKLVYPLAELEGIFGKKIEVAYRPLIEESDALVARAKAQDIGILVIGDPLSATTHVELMMACKQQGVLCEVIQNVSIFTAIGQTGLQLYKFGKTASIPYPSEGFHPTTFYELLKENQSIGAHTLMLFDLRPDEGRFMTVPEAIQQLLVAEEKLQLRLFSKSTMVVACSNLATKGQTIVYAKAGDLMATNLHPPCCLVIPGKLHFMEEEFLERFRQ